MIYKILHGIAGVITALSAIVSWGLPIVLVGLFVTYEIRQDQHMHDKDYIAILEFLMPCFVTTAVMIGLKLGGIL